MEWRIDAQAKGMRIIGGQQAKERRELLNGLIALVEEAGFEEITPPSGEPAQVYTDKAGAEILGQMYAFPDKKGRPLCLRPEGTATVQLLADQHFKRLKNVKLWYFERCWRYEQPQEGRYRELFQFGVEVLNPDGDRVRDGLMQLAERMSRCARQPTSWHIRSSAVSTTTRRMALNSRRRSWARKNRLSAAEPIVKA